MSVENIDSGEKDGVLFFTCATGFYENFIVPYVFFASRHNPNSAFEFLVDDRELFLEKHNVAIEWLNKEKNIEVLIRSVPVLSVKPKMENSIRFLVEPYIKRDYVYIADIDIMLLENIFEWHKPLFEYGLPYSNIVRKGSHRLTGLHFSKYDKMYPLPYIDDLVESVTNDEALLFKIVDRKVGVYSNSLYESVLIKHGVKPTRPLHGVHMSMNRLPFSFHPERVSWAISYKDVVFLQEVFRSKEFSEFYKLLYNGSSQILLNLMFLASGIDSLGEKFYTKMVKYN